MSPKETIQQEMAKVIIIKANILCTVDSFGDISPETVRSIRQDLSQWQHGLPEWMQLDSLLGSDPTTNNLRRVIFLVHLFYLSTVLLVARVSHWKRILYENFDVDEELKNAIRDGVIAARTGARILQLQLSEQAVFQRCWLAEYISPTNLRISRADDHWL